ncbi:hypothetical protein A2U01_0005577, partial [Trifolium medium]|nr:hypothetical protein [Trifolium medium]
MDNLFKDVGKQSPTNDIAEQQSSISMNRRDVGRVMASVTSLLTILNSCNERERGSSHKDTLLLSFISNLRMAGVLGSEEASREHLTISIVSIARRQVGKISMFVVGCNLPSISISLCEFVNWSSASSDHDNHNSSRFESVPSCWIPLSSCSPTI